MHLLMFGRINIEPNVNSTTAMIAAHGRSLSSAWPRTSCWSQVKIYLLCLSDGKAWGRNRAEHQVTFSSDVALDARGASFFFQVWYSWDATKLRLGLRWKMRLSPIADAQFWTRSRRSWSNCCATKTWVQREREWLSLFCGLQGWSSFIQENLGFQTLDVDVEWHDMTLSMTSIRMTFSVWAQVSTCRASRDTNLLENRKDSSTSSSYHKQLCFHLNYRPSESCSEVAWT